MTELDDDDIKRMYFGLIMLYEYFHVTLLNDKSKAGYANERLSGDIFKEDFHLLWLKFMNEFGDSNVVDDLNDDDKSTIELVNYLYDEYGLTSVFRDESKTAVLQNESVKSLIKSSPILTMVFKDRYVHQIKRPCGFGI